MVSEKERDAAGFKERRAAYMRQWYERRQEQLLEAGKLKFCACGCSEPVLSLNKNAKYAKGHWTLGKEFGDTKKAKASPTYGDLRQAAGFLEGEGSFMATKGSKGYPVCIVTAKQNEAEPLEELQRIFGGTLRPREGKEVRFAHREKVYKQKNYWVWWCHQVRARGVMMILYQFMSTRRKGQIREALSKWERNAHATVWERRRQNKKRYEVS